jgi:hypothetical protein
MLIYDLVTIGLPLLWNLDGHNHKPPFHYYRIEYRKLQLQEQAM